MKKFKYIDLFAGVGGFHLALDSLGGEMVAGAEIDLFARTTYRLNFEDKNREVFEKGLFFNDIRKINPVEIPDHDILCAGFPCQAFSIAGYRKGFEDERGNVFFDLLRIIKYKKPEIIFLENVKNLKSHDEGNTFRLIKKSLEDLGYYIKAEVLNSYIYGGVPQNRERIYIVGFRNKEMFDNFSFPNPVNLNLEISDMLEDDVDNEYYYNNKPLYEKIKDYVVESNVAYQWRRKYVRENKNKVFPTLTANMGTGGHNVPIIMDNKGIRKITPRECFNIQGFPKTFLLPESAKSQLYKQAGNAVTVPLIKRVGEKIVNTYFNGNYIVKKENVVSVGTNGQVYGTSENSLISV